MKCRALIPASLLVVLFLYATGCGGGKNEGTGRTNSPTPPSPTSSPGTNGANDDTPPPSASASQPSFTIGGTGMFEVVDEKFVLPETDDLVDIKQFANMLTKSEPKDFPQDSEGWQHYFKLTRQYYKALYDTGVIIHDHSDATEKDQKNALKMQAKGLIQISGLAPDTYLDSLRQLAVKLETEDDTKNIALFCWAAYHQNRLAINAAGGDEEGTRAAFDEVLAFVEVNKNETAIASLVGFLSSFLTFHQNEELAETYAVKLQDILKSSDETMYKSIARNIPQMLKNRKESQKEQEEQNVAIQEGIARREALLGNPMEFECVLLNGDKLNLKDLEGKVVLVDFWASWCPPCRAEVPGMKAAYEQFHDLGFEIIGYNVDWDSGEDVEFLKDYVEKESIPWHVSSAPACEEAGLVNYSEHYGVQSIPTMILIGKDGKVISIEARGEKLISELEKIFGQ
ncbi:MAG: TlpA family protein disulfide reductase [Planctomycetaceae bacterium]|nr:TlpA family protein disulfide reductase [Planctomycetaceae bacterium]